jgi:hypothetical protein
MRLRGVHESTCKPARRRSLVDQKSPHVPRLASPPGACFNTVNISSADECSIRTQDLGSADDCLRRYDSSWSELSLSTPHVATIRCVAVAHRLFAAMLQALTCPGPESGLSFI